MPNASFTLTTDCPDRSGVVAAVSTFIAEQQGLILESHHFRDAAEDRSYMRTVFTSDRSDDPESLMAGFSDIANQFAMEWQLRPSDARCRVLIAVSRQSHCLTSLLHRWKAGSLPIDVVGVVSNHEDNRSLVEWFGLPFHYLPIRASEKAAQEAQLLARFSEARAELLVLARYMQILSPELTTKLAGRCINIHHSFLPSFKGARPYHQAYDRGVKIIGATSHYVTEDLDEGPIIEQAVERVNHTASPKELTELGHDIEAVVLNRAVRWHAEHRIFVRGRRTVVLT